MQSLTTERLKDSGDRRGIGICFGEEPKWLLLCNALGIFQGLVFRCCWITGNHNQRVEGNRRLLQEGQSVQWYRVCLLPHWIPKNNDSPKAIFGRLLARDSPLHSPWQLCRAHRYLSLPGVVRGACLPLSTSQDSSWSLGASVGENSQEDTPWVSGFLSAPD